MTEQPPTEPDNGQDQTPDVRTAVHAVLTLLGDVREHLERERTRESDTLLLRVVAHRSALIRLRRKLEERAEQ